MIDVSAGSWCPRQRGEEVFSRSQEQLVEWNGEEEKTWQFAHPGTYRKKRIISSPHCQREDAIRDYSEQKIKQLLIASPWNSWIWAACQGNVPQMKLSQGYQAFPLQSLTLCCWPGLLVVLIWLMAKQWRLLSGNNTLCPHSPNRHPSSHMADGGKARQTVSECQWALPAKLRFHYFLDVLSSHKQL